MVNQQFFLPMVPDSAPIVINISQYDFDAAGYAGRLFFNLVSNGAAYDMNGATAIFQGEKPDGTTFAYAATVVNASVVRVNVRQQMTTVSGRVVCNLILNNSEGQIGSFNVWLEVQPSSAAGGDPSETDIPALIAQAKEYADAAEQAAEDAEAWSAHPPYIGANGNWFVYDVPTQTFVDTGVYASGSEGNKWYSGTAISGKDPDPTVYPTGIAVALEGDMYLNKDEGAIYQCTLGGADSVAKWVYVMTLTGGGGGGGTNDYNDLDHRPQINGVTLVGNKSSSDLHLQGELTEGDGINIDPVTLELSLDLLAGSNISIETKPSGAIEISSTASGGGSTVSWTQIQGATGATKIAEIEIDGNATDVYAPQGGGGGGHEMIPNATAIASLVSKSQDPTDDDVASGYAIANWSNAESITLYTTLTAGNDTIGVWEEPPYDWKDYDPATDDPLVYRQGWLFHQCLKGIINDNDVEIRIVNGISGEEVGSLYAYRVDDEVYVAVTSPTGNPKEQGWYELSGSTFSLTTDTTVAAGKTYYVGGGAVAIKLNYAPTNNMTVAVKLIRQRTLTIPVTPLQ